VATAFLHAHMSPYLLAGNDYLRTLTVALHGDPSPYFVPQQASFALLRGCLLARASSIRRKSAGFASWPAATMPSIPGSRAKMAVRSNHRGATSVRWDTRRTTAETGGAAAP
jgi:hypothetical protein